MYVLVRSLLRVLASFDALCSLASVSLLPGYARPEILDHKTTPAGMHALNARHPVVETLSVGAFVPNDIELGLGGVRSKELVPKCLVITGPNAGGKSTYMRMVAMLAIMAQVGSYVPASSFAISPYDAIFTRMGAHDSLVTGSSTFFTEMNDMSNIMDNATERSLLIVDELGRGTSTHDGTAIAHASLEYIIDVLRSNCLFVSHYMSVARFCEERPEESKAVHMGYIEDKDADELPRVAFLYTVSALGVDRVLFDLICYDFRLFYIGRINWKIKRLLAVKGPNHGLNFNSTEN